MAKPSKKSAPPGPPASPRSAKMHPSNSARPLDAQPARAATVAAPAAQVAPQSAENDTIYTWHGLQEALRVAPDAKAVRAILDAELNGPARLRWLLRIQGRLQIIRNEEEVDFLNRAARN